MKNAESCNGFPPSVTLWENCGHHPPGSRADLFNWLLEQPQNMMVPAAHSVYGGGEEVHRSQEGGIEQAKQLGRALKVDMPGWFEGTDDSYFKHVNRTTIELSVAEARGSDAELSVRAAATKSEAVTIADPPCCRIPAPVRIAPAEPEQELEAESVAEDGQFPQAAE
ncbi:hypothetical protein GOB19_29755 [Sinorhizobium meliloti]|nr:hypothetical protein [Sinorhizobium meliloti]MDX0005140.1 hypothetical protein [Sinorhizobium meliloti]MDX0017130.1 hypothetical protein [Sinorhizobium meliloti]MDX0166554.1 hypothetical protein [Sinorhizobium meliloti]MDX0216291.1 hypothetical protein [Sinorhizobium meliloti]